MATARDVGRIAQTLKESKILNLDVSIGEFLAVAGLDVINPGEKYGWYVLGGEHFVVVCGLDGVRELVNPIERG